jgi:CubicO group peptidase (beta-lactamase class C family)
MHTRESVKPKWAAPVVAGFLFLSLWFTACGSNPSNLTDELQSIEEAQNIGDLLESLRREHKLPAMAAAAVLHDRVIAAEAVGIRKSGGSEHVTMSDKFHIGSCTKSMTALLAALLVKEGKLTWQTTIAEVFPELQVTMHKDFQTVTLELLLANRAGIPTDLDRDNLWGRIWQSNASTTPVEQRYFLVKEVTKYKPEAKPGTSYIYSNAGFATAGAMMEKTMGKPWEELMKAYIFDPLKMSSAGFGAPASPGKTDQPWGHMLVDGKLIPVDPASGPGKPPGDNPPAIGPAGTVHCSISDFARYAACHVRGSNDGALGLSKAEFQKLHHPLPGQDYALGWLITQRSWGGGTVMTHAGSNTMFFTVMWLAPTKSFAVVVASNAPPDRAAKGCDQAAWALIQRFLLKKS